MSRSFLRRFRELFVLYALRRGVEGACAHVHVCVHTVSGVHLLTPVSTSWVCFGVCP